MDPLNGYQQITRTQDSTLIHSKTNWLDFEWREIWRFRDLVIHFVVKEFVMDYRQTLLGPIWYILQPLILGFIFKSFLGGNQLGESSVNSSPMLFYLSGLVIWGYFSAGCIKCSSSLVGGVGIFNRVYFPRLIMPISAIASKSLVFVTQLGVFLAIYFYQGVSSGNVFLSQNHLIQCVIVIPFCFLITAIFGLGFGLIFASLTVKYRDLQHLLPFVIQVMFFTTPVFYSADFITKKHPMLMILNPLVATIENFRAVVLEGSTLNQWTLFPALGVSFLFLVVGITFFKAIESTFIDVV